LVWVIAEKEPNLNAELGDSGPLKLTPGFVGGLEIQEDEETIIQEGPFKTEIEIATTHTLLAAPMRSPG
jgi:hypothetical protein